MASSDNQLGEAAVRALAGRYRVNLDVRSAAGTIGVQAGRETGASVEIQDFRDYVPGDDPRRIDWLAYGRTGRLVVRLFREEVSPFFDVVVDTSSSMALEDGRKRALCAELCRWLYYSSRYEGIAVRLFSGGERLERVERPEDVVFDQAESVLFSTPQRAAAALRRSSVRLLLTDFMDPADPAGVLRAFSAGCSMLVLLHLLGPWEADPRPEGPVMLAGVETGRTADLDLDRKTIAAYRRLLEAMTAAVRDEMFKCGGLYVPVVADRDLESVLRDDLLPLGLVEVV